VKQVLSIIVMVGCVLATGCEGNSDNGTSTGVLAGTKWKLSGWSVSSLDPSRFTITADFGDSQISGTSAVNLYGGPYTATADGAFSVGMLHATEMAGSDDEMRAESLYLDLLRQAHRYSVTEAALTLKNGGNHEILIFHARW